MTGVSPAPHARRVPRRGACVRVLVLLLALFLPGLPGAGVPAQAVPAAVAGAAAVAAAEQDVLDTAPRPPAGPGARALVRPRPAAPAPAAVPASGRAAALTAPASAALRPVAPRRVVLRC
ncbi:hypothetical protein [Streptomyces anandii]|uniref:hypothetical protein n=1 Tax=Streptomyces anandii TaxID=285454 RepID=UPI003788C7C8